MQQDENEAVEAFMSAVGVVGALVRVLEWCWEFGQAWECSLGDLVEDLCALAEQLL